MEKGIVSIAAIITAVLMFAFGFILIISSWYFHQNINEQMYQNCKFCSIFQKEDCPYTVEEMMAEEHSNGPCSDMGSYEMLWKFSLGFVFFGIGLIGIAIAITYSQLQTIINLKYSKSHKRIWTTQKFN